MSPINAEIITSGRELLIGKTINTNASWIAKQLTEIGVEVRRISVMGDTVTDISQAVKESLERTPGIIITTGGLGSTYDDVTTEGIASALSLPLELNNMALEQIRARYDSMGFEMTPYREKMAMMPIGASPLTNDAGSAPGIFVEYRGTLIFCLPGVPKEMMAMFTSRVLNIIKGRAPHSVFRERSFDIEGISESSLAPLIESWAKLHPDIYIKSHPAGEEGIPIITVHLTTTGKDICGIEDSLLKAEESFSEAVLHLRAESRGKNI